MKRTILSLIIIMTTGCAMSQNPKWAKKARMAQVTIVATDAKGELHETQGTFVNDDGDIITEYDALKGAVKAIAIDQGGTEIPIGYVLGANSMYNVAKLSTHLPEKYKLNQLTIGQPAGERQPVWIMSNAKAEKKASCAVDTVIQATAFRDSFTYYTLSSIPATRMSTSPVMNGQGEQWVYDPSAPTYGTDFETFDTNVTQGSWINAAAVPEPTSGLLLILGVAGLALKRRRA